jgi:hypothetical protein
VWVCSWGEAFVGAAMGDYGYPVSPSGCLRGIDSFEAGRSTPKSVRRVFCDPLSLVVPFFGRCAVVDVEGTCWFCVYVWCLVCVVSFVAGGGSAVGCCLGAVAAVKCDGPRVVRVVVIPARAERVVAHNLLSCSWVSWPRGCAIGHVCALAGCCLAGFVRHSVVIWCVPTWLFVFEVVCRIAFVVVVRLSLSGECGLCAPTLCS